MQKEPGRFRERTDRRTKSRVQPAGLPAPSGMVSQNGVSWRQAEVKETCSNAENVMPALGRYLQGDFTG